MLCPLKSPGKGLNGAVNSTALRAAWSAVGRPDDLCTRQDSKRPSLAILNNSTTVLLSLPFGGSQLSFILRCNSLIYGPKSGSRKASIPGAPPPPPGLPTLPVPPAEEPLENCPEPPLLDGESDGLGAYALLDEPPAEVPDFAIPVGADVPPTGPVDNVFPIGAAFGTGTVNGVVGLATGVGAETGLALGRGVGGAGFAGEGFSTAGFCCAGFCCTGFGC